MFLCGEKRSTNGAKVENAKVEKPEAMLGDISFK